MMSCNGCRVLRKGCSEQCVLRQCLRSIEGPQAQGHATLFVAKFFGRAALLSFISAVPEPQRPALFQSLLFEAVGRAINPVGGVVGMLWTGNWQLCQSAVEIVLQGGALHPLPESESVAPPREADNCSESGVDCFRPQCADSPKIDALKRPGSDNECKFKLQQQHDLDLSLMHTVPVEKVKKRRPQTAVSEESKTTTSGSGSSSESSEERRREIKLLRLFL